MPRYREVWAEEPKAYRASYPPHVQQQLDQRIAELLEDPRARARFYPGLRLDQWIASFGPNLEGTIVYSVKEGAHTDGGHPAGVLHESLT
jgi:hypothetical protein